MYKIYYNNFWDNYISDTHNWLFSRIFNDTVVETNDYLEADILCNSVNKNFPDLLDKKQWKYTFLISYENWFGPASTNLDKYSCILSGFVNLKNQIEFPYFLERIIEKGSGFLPISSIPKKQVCAVIRNGSSLFRNKFMKDLEKKIRIDYGGPYKNNIGRCVVGNHDNGELIDFYKQYKFVISMENSVGEYYITEKIFNVLKSGTIPIYWGSPNIHKYINPKRFIHIKNNTTEEIMRVIRQIIKMTDEEYIAMVNQPIFLKNIDTILDEKIQEIQTFLRLV